tara:strand:+ start:309 stop:767 length:459 start_codon:yes stop_codon:yes gene_type:complete
MSDARMMQRLIQKGANAEFARLEPRIDKLKQAVAMRGETIASLTKEVRALRATALANAVEIDELRQRVEHGDNERQSWMRWAWVGQPESENSDDAVYQVKISMLQNAVAYWERRARNEYPARTQDQVDMDAAVVFSTCHLRLDDILRLMEKM